MKLLRRLIRKQLTEAYLNGLTLGESEGYRRGLRKAKSVFTDMLDHLCECDDEWTCHATRIERQFHSEIKDL